MRNCVSLLCFKRQVPDLSLFVILKPSPLGEGAPVRTLGRMRGQVPAPSPVGAHIVRPRFLSKLRRRSGSPHPPAKKERMRDKIPKMSMDCTNIGRGLAPAAPFVGRGLPTRRPGLPRLRRRGGTLGRPPSNKRTPPKFPIYVSKRPTKGTISPI